MKRIFSIALLAVFIFSTVGVIAGSYCCGMKEMSSKMKSCCSPMSKNCCGKKEVKLLKVSDDFLSAIPQHVIKSFSPLELWMPFNFLQNEIASLISSPRYIPDHAPPVKTIARLAFIQSFLI